MINLFCFPFAGGGAISYRGLGNRFDGVSVSTLELPGRGTRFSEPLLYELDHIVDDLCERIRCRLDNSYAFFGHSMGATVAYALTKRIIEEGLPQPRILFLSGSRGPSVSRNEQRHLLPRPEFFEMLMKLGGCPEEILNERELMELYEPVLRADFAVIDNYRHRQTPPLNMPIIVFNGVDDSVSADEAREWQRESTQLIRYFEFPGDHFFIFRHWESMRRIFSEHLVGMEQA
jgi:surfactin synthase thioesterase subunit